MIGWFFKIKQSVAAIFVAVLFLGLGCSQSIGGSEDTRLLPVPEGDGSGLKLYWSGAASVVIESENSSVLIDPFVSRKANTLGDIIFRRDGVVDTELVAKRYERAEISKAVSILVSHTHYDHSIDIAAFAGVNGIPVFGSASMSRIAKADGIRNFNELTVGSTSKDIGGGFKVTVIKSKHGNPPVCLPIAGCIDPLEEHVAKPFKIPASVRAYGAGEVFTYFVEHKLGNVLHIGTAGVVATSLDHLKGEVDVVMLSLVGRGDTDRFLKEIVAAVEPRFVIPIHYDNLFKPIKKGVRVTPVAKLNEFFRAMEKTYDHVTTGTIAFDEPWILPPD